VSSASSAAAAAAEGPAAAAAAARARGGGEAAPEVDEFGRTVALQHKHEVEEGAGRRRRLVAAALRQLAAMEAGARLDLEEPLDGEQLQGGFGAGGGGGGGGGGEAGAGT
jgi:hypothetical protein